MKELFDLLDRPIAFHRPFVTLAGSVNAALLLSQAIYWSKRTKDPEGWFYKSARDWEEETGLTRREQETARKSLKALGFWLEDLRGVPATMYFRIDSDRLYLSFDKNAKLDSLVPSNQLTPNRQTSITENTTETTTGNPLLVEVEEVFKYFDLLRKRAGYKGDLKRTPARIKLVVGRLKEKFNRKDFIDVLNHKFHTWAHDEKWREYLTPETLFRPSNFPKYVEAVKDLQGPVRDWTEQRRQAPTTNNHTGGLADGW